MIINIPTSQGIAYINKTFYPFAVHTKV